ncbi:MAG TPA: alpha/beta fold hydrolase [Microlunatus sp.]|nr:alpha/beta fold hydrolase [Microlunatus sp.]
MKSASFPAAVRRLLLTALAGVGALLIGVGPALLPAYADDAPVTEITLQTPGTPEPDGDPVSLDTSVWTTDPGVPKPAIVLAHGFGGTKDDAAQIAATLARTGYTVITYTARGFGASGGLIHLGNPAYEGRDAVRVVDEAVARPEVAKDGGDPVIGFAGASYGGAAALLAAGLDPRVDAIVSAFTWHSLRQALVPQHAVSAAGTSLADVTPDDEVGVFKQRWAGLFFLSGLQGGSDPGGTPGQGGQGQGGQGANLCGRFATDICQEYLQTALTGDPSPGLLNLLDRSSMDRVLGQITAPTLIVQGENDTLFTLDQADANFRGLPASTPAAMAWVEGGHDGGIDLEKLLPQWQSWFDRYLRNDQTAPAPATFSAAVPTTALVGRDQDRGEPTTITAADYPGRTSGTVEQVNQSLAGDTQQVVSPPGGVPTAMTSLPGGSEAVGGAAAVAAYPLAVLPGQSAVFTSPVLEAPQTLLGSGRIRLEVTSSATSATLFVSLWDLGPDTTPASPTPGGSGPGSAPGEQSGTPQTAVLPQSVVAPVHLVGLTPDRATTVDVALPAVAHQVPVGHRLRVVVSSTDQAYANPKAGAVYDLQLAGSAQLTLPRLPTAQVVPQTLDVPLPLLLVVSALVVLAIVGALLLGRRERAGTVREDLRPVPLVVENLEKTYADGLRAVDGVSFRAEPGQVVGLLGPNGAGKTTVMRMLVGLIKPDAGAVFVHGESVGEGAEVLRDVGAFIEGPGFLPHLTGRQNLDAYWEVTGRPPAEAHLDEALAVAGLGPALDRRVRAYSQGMRQRLGIAQAMLGQPPLLLLDEPTNGLDPPQINAMRAVLRDYAASGRTVVVSSHLLGEVEQTCTHVVMMTGGRVVLTGSVEELTRGHTVSLEQVFLDSLTGALR